MRDSHRMKEKYDLSLDSRQVVSLMIAGIIVLGAVFILGVVVGKKLTTDGRASRAPDLLAALDEKAAALDEVQKADASLTFQDELTKKEPTLLPPEPPAVKAAPEEDVVAVLPKSEKASPPSELGQVLEGKVETVPVPTRTATKDGGLKDALARAERKPSEPPAPGAFTLQISASQSKDEADRFAAKLRERGYAPYILEATVPGRGTWYRVRMGNFPSRESAGRFLQDFRRETQLEAFVAGAN